MAPPPYAPYYFNGGWVQPPMAPYAFHPGWTAPRKSVHDRITRPVRDRLSYGANRSFQSKTAQKVWRPKSASAKVLESGKQQDANADSVIIGAHRLKLKGPVIDEPAKSVKAVVVIQPKSSANDHEASTSQAHPRDPKYTQPKWCPPGLTKTKKRRLQRMRNQQKVEDEAEKWRDKYFDEVHPTPAKM